MEGILIPIDIKVVIVSCPRLQSFAVKALASEIARNAGAPKSLNIHSHCGESNRPRNPKDFNPPPLEGFPWAGIYTHVA